MFGAFNLIEVFSSFIVMAAIIDIFGSIPIFMGMNVYLFGNLRCKVLILKPTAARVRVNHQTAVQNLTLRQLVQLRQRTYQIRTLSH